MQIQFGTSSKRVNSTFIPAMSRTYNCTLKRPCTIETPVVDISDFNINYNVAYIPDFGRYYFVSDIESITNAITRYHLTVDPLASFKTNVLAQRVFVSRSQSHGSNMLVDPYATHTADNPNIYNVAWDIDKYNVGGFYVLQTAGHGTARSIGQAVNTYLIDDVNLRALIDTLFTANTYDESGAATVSGLEKTYFNPFQYLISCKWFPLDTSAVETEVNPSAINFGWWTVPATVAHGYRIRGETVSSYTDFSLPSAVDWTATSPDYSRYTLYVPGVGTLEVDPAFAGLPLYCLVWTDLLTGGCRCEIRYQTGTTHGSADPILSVANGYWGVEVMLTQLASDASNLASNFYNAVSGISGGYTFADTLGSTLAGGGAMAQIANVGYSLLETVPFVRGYFKEAKTNSLQPALSVNGAVGNFSELLNFPRIKLTVKHYDKLEPNMDVTNGLPFNRNIVLNQLTGYTQCNNASITVAGATIKEKLAIKSYLEGGFWIE